MGKRKASSGGSDNEGNLNALPNVSRKKFNKLLSRTGHLTSENELANSDQLILGKKLKSSKSKHTDDAANSELNTKVKKRQKEVVSSSGESESSELQDQDSFIKNRVKQETFNSVQHDKLETVNSTGVKEDSESNSSSSDEEESVSKNKMQRTSLHVNRRRKSKSLDSKAEAESEDEANTSNATKVNNKFIKKEIELTTDDEEHINLNLTQSHSELISDEGCSSSDSEATRVSNTTVVIKEVIPRTYSVRDTNSSEEEGETTNVANEEDIMEKIDERIRNQSNSDMASVESLKRKVNVLQDISFTPTGIPPIERLHAMYPGIKQIQTNFSLEYSDCKDFYLFRIPKNVDAHQLDKLEISLEKECKINIGETYNTSVSSKVPDPMLVISDNCKVVHFNSDIRLKKYIKSKKEPKIVIPEKTSVPLPPKLKKRHPLFGSDFKNKIKLSEEVEQKLDEAIANLIKQEKKSKKKKHKKYAGDEEKKQEEDILNLFNSHSFPSNKPIKETSEDSAIGSFSSIDSTKKRNKKDRESNISEILKDIKTETAEIDCSLENRSHKKKKKINTSSIQWGEPSNSASTEITEIISTPGSRTPKKIKKEKTISNQWDKTFNSGYIETTEIDSTLENSSHKKSKKKKHSRNDWEEASNSGGIETEVDSKIIKTEVFPSPSKKEKKRQSLINSTLLSDDFQPPNFCPEISRISEETHSTEKKSKKSKKKRESDVDRSEIEKQLISNVLHEIHSDLKPHKKLKKIKKT